MHSTSTAVTRNSSGLLRQYFPKGTDPSGYTEEHLDAVAMEPNDRPRKTPDHMKPSEKTPRTDRRHRNIHTNRHQQHQLSTKMLQRPLESATPFPRPPLLPFLFSPLASHHTPQYQPTSLSSPDLAIHLNVTQNNTLTNTTHQPTNKHNISQPDQTHQHQPIKQTHQSINHINTTSQKHQPTIKATKTGKSQKYAKCTQPANHNRQRIGT